MSPIRIAVAALAALAVAPAQDDVLPFPYQIHDFDNGLRLITVTTDFPGVVSVHCVVSVGSRHEVEAGRSGFAHFFEHMMFRGTENLTAAEQAARFKAAGADRNAYTTDDYTDYHTTVPTGELEEVLQLEADRFQHLQYPQDVFRTEAMAVFGEYNKNSSNPVNMLFERIRATAFDQHTYAHTTMGFLKDIRAMPRMYDYSLSFFDRFYRPENTTLLVVGDVPHEPVREMVARYWSDWERGDHHAQIPVEPPQTEPRSVAVKWPAPTGPWIVVAFKGPAFTTEQLDMQALDLLSQVWFGPTSDLYGRLFVRERIVDQLFPYFPDRADPGLVYVFARAREAKDWATVRDAILAECERARTELVDAQQLEDVKSAQRYSFLGALDSSESIAAELAGYVALARTPAVVGEVYENYAACTPRTLRQAAQQYLVPSGRTIATLSHEPLPEAPPPDATVAAGEEVPAVLLPSSSPLITFRLIYPTGAVDDPDGKAGLAHVTAQMLVSAGTQQHGYEELLAAFYPMATTVAAGVDEEVTLVTGTVHRDNLERYYELLKEMLLQPAFDPEDLERVKANTISAIDVGLRRADDEELGKEVLLQEIFAGHPYESLNMGAIETIRSITVDDVRAFWKEHFVDPVIGLAGAYPSGFPARVHGDLGGASAVFASHAEIPKAPPIEANRLTIVQKTTLATGIHLGFPLEVTRADADWIALWLVRSFFGEHRSEISYLYQRLREIRGLNYGDYAYIEYFPNGGGQSQPPPNHPRQRPVFSIWIRLVPPENAPFALKAAHYELEKLVADGLTAEQFESTRDYLVKYCALLVKSGDRRLGYALDQAWYGLDAPWVDFVRTGLEALTLEQVNAAIRRHLRADRLQIVAVTEDAQAFRDAVTGSDPTPVHYQSPPAQAILDEDAIIERRRIPLDPDRVRIVPVEEVFAR